MPCRTLLCCLILSAAGWAPRAAAQAGVPEVPLPESAEAPWEGAIGLVATYQPEYQGASEHTVRLRPVAFLRYGRFAVSSGVGRFGTRRAGDVARGFSLTLVDSERLRFALGLRYDGGRGEAESGALAGLGDIPPTLRLRAGASLRLKGPWRLGASWSVDAFGRGGGSYGELSAGWERDLAPRWTLMLGGSLGLAGERYMQTYYGVSPAQAERTGYPVYEPAAGLREIGFSAALRHRLNDQWTLVGGAGVSRLLGPAAASPLTDSPSGWGINAGAVWRF